MGKIAIETTTIQGVVFRTSSLKKISKKNFLLSFAKQLPNVDAAWSQIEKEFNRK